MKKIRVLQIKFSNRVTREQLPLFRAAIIKAAGRKNIIFHNHTKAGYVYGYPLIQYKHIRKRPSIVCLEKAVEDIHHFFSSSKKTIILDGTKTQLEVEQIRANQYNLQVWDREFLYTIDRWIPFSQENYNEYQKMEYLDERVRFMETILRGNIISFAKGVGWDVDKEVKVKIVTIDKRNVIPVKETPKEAYRLKFKTNVFLPNYIGLGRHTALGFGVIRHIKSDNK